MPKIDSIEPNIKKSSSVKKVNKPSKFVINLNENISYKKKEKNKERKKGEAGKKRLMFFLVFFIMIVVVTGWLFLLKKGLIFTNDKNNDQWTKIKEGIGSIFKGFKSDIFNEKKDIINTNFQNENERIKDFEERLFPEFINVNKTNQNVNNTNNNINEIPNSPPDCLDCSQGGRGNNQIP